MSERLDPKVLRLAAVLILGVFGPLLASTVVSVAIPTLGHELDAPVSTVQWVGTGYLLALAMTIPISGWTVERFGHRRMWLAALLVFLAGSLLAGVAWDIHSLIAFRAVQGAGAGLTALGTAPFTLADEHTSEWLLAPALVVLGVGLSAANMGVLVGAFRDLRADQMAHASSTTRIMQQLGGAFGTAVVAVILQNQLTGHSAATAFGTTFLWVFAFTALAVVPALLLTGPGAGRATAQA